MSGVMHTILPGVDIRVLSDRPAPPARLIRRGSHRGPCPTSVSQGKMLLREFESLEQFELRVHFFDQRIAIIWSW